MSGLARGRIKYARRVSKGWTNATSIGRGHEFRTPRRQVLASLRGEAPELLIDPAQHCAAVSEASKPDSTLAALLLVSIGVDAKNNRERI